MGLFRLASHTPDSVLISLEFQKQAYNLILLLQIACAIYGQCVEVYRRIRLYEEGAQKALQGSETETRELLRGTQQNTLSSFLTGMSI